MKSDCIVVLLMKELVNAELVAKNLTKKVKDLTVTLQKIKGQLQII